MFAALSRFTLLLFLLPSLAQAQASSRQVDEIVRDLAGRLAAGDCPGAVGFLREGLKGIHPDIALLAGSMYENGLCLKPDWDKAVTLYTQAHHGGLREGADRLAAGFADPANGPDMAAALWWGMQGHTGRIEGCQVSREAEKDPDRFVAELKAWHPVQLAACNYAVGVMSTVSAEAKRPPRREAGGTGAAVVLHFLPAVPRVDLESGGDAATGKAATFEAEVRMTAERALRRYPRPDGIPPASRITVIYDFPSQ